MYDVGVKPESPRMYSLNRTPSKLTLHPYAYFPVYTSFFRLLLLNKNLSPRLPGSAVIEQKDCISKLKMVSCIVKQYKLKST